MRVSVLCLALVVATPAAAQVSALELDNLRAQQEAAQRRAIDLDNQLMAAEARLRADQAVGEMQLQQRLPIRLPAPVAAATPDSTGPAAAAPLPVLPQIPDSLLADSNRRVREATDSRR